MYRRKSKNTARIRRENSVFSSSGDRGSDIAAPDSTSLMVNRSKVTDDSPDELPKSVTATLYDGDDEGTESMGMARPSTSLITSMTQKEQSTPKEVRPILRDATNDVKTEVLSDELIGEIRPSQQGGGSSRTTSQRSRCSFLNTLAECGAEEILGVGSFKLSEDQAILWRKLNKKMIAEGFSDEFLTAFKTYIGNVEKLKKVLMMTQTSKDCDVARGPVQDPLLRILLHVDCLQSRILDILLTKITDITTATDITDQPSLVSGILRQVRCLNRVSDTKFASKLLELIPTASALIQQEIVFLLPELVIKEELAEVTTRLAAMLEQGTGLTPMIIDCLGNLCLSTELKEQVWETLLSKLELYPPGFLPSLVNFVISKSDPQKLNAVVKALRANLPSSLCRMDNPSRKTMFHNLKISLMLSKALTEAWIKAVTNLDVPSDFTFLDLMAMILVYGHVFNRKKTTLSLLKNRIRLGVLTAECFKETFKNLNVVVVANHKEVLDLSSALIKSFEHAVADVAKAMCVELFATADSFLRLDLVRDLIVHLTTGSANTVQNVVSVLLSLRSKHLALLEPHASLFMSVLRIIPDIDLSLARQVVDLVASLVILPEQEDSGLFGEMSIFVRKQMIAWQPEVYHRGIMAGVTLVKHCAFQLGRSHTTDFLSEAEFLLRMAAGSQSSPPARRGFFFDELATVIRESNRNVPFLMSWPNRIHQALDTVFVTDLELECDHFPMAVQYSIENAGNLNFPALAFFLNPKSDDYLNFETIPAALRLLWSGEKDMQRILPMLCASVILPDSSVFERFLSYSPALQKIIMDSLFLCANYFIECINALSSQKKSEKLIIRLKQLIEVRKLIYQYSGQIPDYTPPLCQFHVPVAKTVAKKQAGEGKKNGRGRKRKADGQEVNLNLTHLDASALPCTSTAAPTEAIAQVATNTENPSGLNLNGAFRELQCHALKLLRMELKLNPTKVFKKKKMSNLIVMDVSWSYRPEDKPELGPSDTLYLLQDYLAKSDLILRDRPCFVSKKACGLVVESISAEQFVNATVKLLPKLYVTLDVASSYCKDLLDANDGIWDAPGCFPAAASDIKSCFCALLKIFADLLAWLGFQNPANAAILKEILITFSRKSTEGNSQSAASLAYEAARVLSNLGGVVPLLSGGVFLTRAVQSCVTFSGSKDFSLVGELCRELIKRPWFTLTGAPERGVAYNQQVDCVVRMHLARAENRLTNIREVAETCREELRGLLGKDSSLPTFPTLTKSNFPLLFRALCEALVSASSEELIKNASKDEKCIDVWLTVTGTLAILAEISKSQPSRTNLAALLKRSQGIIQLFLNKGLPVMESALRIKSDEVLSVLKSLQMVTRYLHSICNHSKITNDTVIAAHVPKIRAMCERLNLEVKGMLILNKIPLDYITIAVLKNRDIDGKTLESQELTSDDESELPAEEEVDAMDDEDIPDDPADD